MRGLLGAALVAACAFAAACGASVAEEDLTFVVSVRPSPPAMGMASIEIVLSAAATPAATAVTGAAVRIEGTMSHAGMVPVFADAEEVRPGVYSAGLDLTMAGDWFLLITAQLADGCTVEHTHELPGVRRGS